MNEPSYASVMEDLQREIQADYESLRAIAGKDPQRAGHGGEQTWADLLRNWLPPAYEVDTRKYIVHEDGTPSFETDIVVFRPSCPRPMRQKAHVLAGGVAAAFSVKTTLYGYDLEHEIKRSVALRRSLRVRVGSVQGEILPPFPYGILAHSSEWQRSKRKGPSASPARQISQKLDKHESSLVTHPRELLDFMCIADAAAWSTMRVTHITPAMIPGETAFTVATATISTDEDTGTDASEVGIQFGPKTEVRISPVGAFITALLIRLSYTDPTVAPIADSMLNNGLMGFMKGTVRWWDVEKVYSPDTIARLPHIDMKTFDS